MKPANLCRPSFGDGPTYLIDFGLSSRFESEEAIHISECKEEAFKGNLMYCSKQ